MRLLTLLRHAKAVEGRVGQDDFERDLTPAGRDAARAVGAATRDSPAQLVLTSSARRTLVTTELVASCWSPPAEIFIRPALYLASEDSIVTEIAAVDDAVRDLWVVGHNPGLGALARELALSATHRERFPSIAFGFPTAARATFQCEIDRWVDLIRGPRTIAFFGRARNHVSGEPVPGVRVE